MASSPPGTTSESEATTEEQSDTTSGSESESEPDTDTDEDSDESRETNDHADENEDASKEDAEREMDEILRGHPRATEQAMTDGGTADDDCDDRASDGGGDPV